MRGHGHRSDLVPLRLLTSYEVITTPTDIIMVIEYAGGELFNYIVEVRYYCLV